MHLANGCKCNSVLLLELLGTNFLCRCCAIITQWKGAENPCTSQTPAIQHTNSVYFIRNKKAIAILQAQIELMVSQCNHFNLRCLLNI